MLRNFLTKAESFSGFGFQGSFGMGIDQFMEFYDIYIDTGNNLLDTWARYVWNTWKYEKDDDNYSYYSRGSFIKEMDGLRDLYRYEFIDTGQYKKAIRFVLSNVKIQKRYERKRCDDRRKIASRYISRSDIREEVFKLHGRRCLCCGATKTLSMDHIIPVVSGGKDEVENLQPLCRTCNSTKNSKTIDYRKDGKATTK